jgi:hypothetical protein
MGGANIDKHPKLQESGKITNPKCFILQVTDAKVVLKLRAGNTKRGSIIVPLISCLTGLESAV